MAEPPTCKGCGGAHWNFVSCEAAREKKAADVTTPEVFLPFAQRKSFRPLFDRDSSNHVFGGSLVLEPRRKERDK